MSINILIYAFQRLLHMIPILFIISIVLFFVTRAMPGDPVDQYLGVGAEVTAERRESVREMLGLNAPLYVQYFRWMGRTVRGDFGDSLVYRRPVSEVVAPFLWNSFILNIGGMLISIILIIPIGVLAAVHKGKMWDRFWTVFTLIGFCVPSFFTALILIFIFSIQLKLTPISGMMTVGANYTGAAHVIDVMRHLALPITVVVLGSMAGLFRYVRNAMLEVIHQDYIRTAKAKGVKGWRIIYVHALRNALIPIITLMGFMIPALFGGSVIIETIFVWPGIGRELYSAIIGRDYNLMLALNMFFALLTLLGNLLADICYAIADPRVRLE